MKAITKLVPVVETPGSSGSRGYALSEVRLSMYIVPPVGEITVEELELFAVDRLKGKTERERIDFVHFALASIRAVCAQLCGDFACAVLKEIENIRVRGLTGAPHAPPPLHSQCLVC
jgi:hypothetical protein